MPPRYEAVYAFLIFSLYSYYWDFKFLKIEKSYQIARGLSFFGYFYSFPGERYS